MFLLHFRHADRQGAKREEVRCRKEGNREGKGEGKRALKGVSYPETMGRLKFDWYEERYLTKTSRIPKSKRTLIKV